MDDKLPNMGTLMGYAVAVGLVAVLGFFLWCAIVKMLFAVTPDELPPFFRRVKFAKKTQLVLGLGLLLVVLNGLFPPFEWPVGYDHHHGYRFIFAAPEGAKIILSQFFVQFVTITAATAGAYFLFWLREKRPVAGSEGAGSVKETAETLRGGQTVIPTSSEIKNN